MMTDNVSGVDVDIDVIVERRKYHRCKCQAALSQLNNCIFVDVNAK